MKQKIKYFAFSNPIEKLLFYISYGAAWYHHRPARKLQTLNSNLSVSHTMPTRARRLVAKLISVTACSRAHAAIAERKKVIKPTQSRRLCSCVPAAIKVEDYDAKKFRACHYYTVCPHCFYRNVYKAIKKLRNVITPDHMLASIVLPIGNKSFSEDPAYGLKTIERYYKNIKLIKEYTAGWEYAIIIPYFMWIPKEKEWFIANFMFAVFSDEIEALPFAASFGLDCKLSNAWWLWRSEQYKGPQTIVELMENRIYYPGPALRRTTNMDWFGNMVNANPDMKIRTIGFKNK